MTISEWLTVAVKKLTQAGIGTARLDALVLLEDVISRDRSWILAHDETELSPRQSTDLKKLLTRRAQHEPLAYVRGRTEFYGRSFIITPAVLEPRPESEMMIDLLKELSAAHVLPQNEAGITFVADVGTGSGALGITAALEVPECRVELLEIDPAAAGVAKTNVDLFTLNIPVTVSDLLAQATRPADVLLCNLPYVPDEYQINRAASHEPDLAIFGGPDGLEVYRKLFKQIKIVDEKPLYILSEALPPQHYALAALAKQYGYQQVAEEDFIQVFRLATT